MTVGRLWLQGHIHLKMEEAAGSAWIPLFFVYRLGYKGYIPRVPVG